MENIKKQNIGTTEETKYSDKKSISKTSDFANYEFDKDLQKYHINYHNNSNFFRCFEDMHITD